MLQQNLPLWCNSLPLFHPALPAPCPPPPCRLYKELRLGTPKCLKCEGRPFPWKKTIFGGGAPFQERGNRRTGRKKIENSTGLPEEKKLKITRCTRLGGGGRPPIKPAKPANGTNRSGPTGGGGRREGKNRGYTLKGDSRGVNKIYILFHFSFALPYFWGSLRGLWGL